MTAEVVAALWSPGVWDDSTTVPIVVGVLALTVIVIVAAVAWVSHGAKKDTATTALAPSAAHGPHAEA